MGAPRNAIHGRPQLHGDLLTIFGHHGAQSRSNQSVIATAILGRVVSRGEPLERNTGADVADQGAGQRHPFACFSDHARCRNVPASFPGLHDQLVDAIEDAAELIVIRDTGIPAVDDEPVVALADQLVTEVGGKPRDWILFGGMDERAAMVVGQAEGRAFRISAATDAVAGLDYGNLHTAHHQGPGGREASHARTDNDDFRIGRNLCQYRRRDQRCRTLQ